MGLCGVHEGKRSESRLFLVLLCVFFFFSSYANDFIESVGKNGELANSQVA